MSSLDPFVVGAVANRFSSLLNEQQTVLVSTAFSSVVRESLDLACGIFDSQGNMIGQSVGGTPGHINAMATGMRHFVDAYPPGTLDPGDVLLTNDPWMTAGQINDMSVATPVFLGQRLVAWFATCCHAPDIGGRVVSAQASDVFEEGLALPIMKLVRAGRVNDELIAVIRQNVRTPDETVGDLYAQISANAVGAESLLRLMAEYQLETIDDIAAEIMDRSEAALRAALRELPEGSWETESSIDGVSDEPLLLRLRATISGGQLTLDFTGSSPESRYGINVVENYTRAYTSFAVKAVVAPDIPHNAGSFRPVEVIAPEGSIVNARRPAPVASRHLVGHFLPSIIFRALAGVLPERVMAESADAVWLTVWRSEREDGSPFMLNHFQSGGAGAREGKDGLSSTSFPSGLRVVPTEVLETITPLIEIERTLRTDSGGAGRFRGGLGQVATFQCRGTRDWLLNASAGRVDNPARGLAGGQAGAAGFVGIGPDSPIASKRQIRIAPDTKVYLRLPGGGGYGSPQARDPESVLADVAAGYVSIEAAREDYHVAVNYIGPEDALVRPPHWYVFGDREVRA
jgi:N-methylhydantoinase B